MKDLNEIPNKSPFKVPENYFKEVNRRIIAANTEQGFAARERSVYVRLRPYLALAAAVAVLLTVGYMAVNYLSNNRSVADLPMITLNEFSDNYLNDIDLLTLEEGAESFEPELARTDISNKDIIEYLVLENIDINDIFEQF
jgi:hypothetical protein